MPYHFISFFREIFVFHHSSLEFRAKVLAAILLAKNELKSSDWDDISDIASEIYFGDIKRQKVLIATIKEYIAKFKIGDLDRLLMDISADIKAHNRFAKKIDFSHLRRLMADSSDDEALLQQRIYEFFFSEVKG